MSRAPRREELSDSALVQRSWGMAFATLISRLTGFARIVLLAAILGAALSSSFSVANQLPNLVAALVLEATFTAIFVPVLARAEQDDPDGGAAFVRRLVTLATALLVLASTLSVLAAPLLVRLMLGRDPAVNQPLTTAFAYLLLPQVLAYGLSSVFMAILNTRNVFGPPAWAPVVNNVVAIATLGVYLAVPGELSVDPVHMSNPKLLVLGIGTTLGVFAQATVLLAAIRRQHISLRPLWGIDERLKRFGAMAAAMVLYVAISQIGLVVGNQIASTAAASGPAIYNYTWLVLMLPFGMIGVTVLTVVMPRLSRNAAAEDIPAVLADLSLATRLTMITLIPTVAFMTVGGPAMGSALFAYGNFGQVDAGYLGTAIALSAFTLIPYALVLLQLRVFYAREQPWTPIAIIVVITAVKILGSILAPHLTANRDLVAGLLGAANGLGFLAGAIVGHILLRRSLRPRGGALLGMTEVRTILVTTAASLLAALIAFVADRLLGLDRWTAYGGMGSLLRLLALAVIMVPVLAAVLIGAQVPEATAALRVIKRPLETVGSRPTPLKAAVSARHHRVAYPDRRNSSPPGDRGGGVPIQPRPPATPAGLAKGPEVSDRTSDSAPPPSIPDRQPAGDSRLGDSPMPAEEAGLVPGARIANGRYRLLISHGGTSPLHFWQALDTALDRQVALTFVDPEGALPEGVVQDILSRTLRLSQIDKPGIARVLDVVQIDTGGLVVAEWIRGASLREVADTSPPAMGAIRAVQALTAAAQSAHHTGVALSLDDPSRIRVSIDGDVVLAYPATMPAANPRDDIRGIGACLYALLIDRWPLPEMGERSGLRPADTDAEGRPVEPNRVNPAIPFQISAVATRSVQQDGGIRTASTLLNLLRPANAVAGGTEVLGSSGETPAGPAERGDERDANASLRRRRNIVIGAAIGGVALLVTLLVLASVVRGIFGDLGSGLQGDQLGLNESQSASDSPGDLAAPGSMVQPTAATVFSPAGGADNPGTAGLAIDGKSTTAWKTDVYSDPVPFPSFKNGVGLMLQLPRSTKVGVVTIDVSSIGTKVELRSSSSPNPSKLDETKALAPAAALQPGHNTIHVDADDPTSNLLVWISTLGTTNGMSLAEISEITVEAAS
ncbi:murein biosynthesis integral membrane protein MurJ [Mycobacterium sp.]|uniref:murein biosynthesis integral membrane protein MurJ n=1 Tax=Mycobacterium sp. TaxID=1785 RepID=UPI003A885C42